MFILEKVAIEGIEDSINSNTTAIVPAAFFLLITLVPILTKLMSILLSTGVNHLLIPECLLISFHRYPKLSMFIHTVQVITLI